jgi:Protein of unknown function (DUF1565)
MTATFGKTARAWTVCAAVRSCLLLSSAPASATTWYVSTTGNDSNQGTQASPFATLIQGAAVAQAGDTVLVMDGTYGNTGIVDPTGQGIAVVSLQHSGTASAPITFMAQDRGQVILDAGNTSTSSTCNGAYSYFNLNSVSFVVIQGFVIQNGCNEAIHSNNSAHDITIRWDELQYIANHYIDEPQDTTVGRDGIYLNNTEYNFTFDGDIFHDIGRTGCLCTDMHFDHGIYTCGFSA